MIKLYQFPPAWDLPNASPFCMKVETYLRMAALPYEIVSVLNPAKGPKGKLPVIKDDGRVVSDSGFIVDYLKQRYGDPLDARLDDARRARALALRRLMEEHLYWCVLYDRWVAHWPITKAAFFGRLPALMRDFIAALVRRGMRRQLHAQGVGRHAREEIYELGAQDLAALAELMGDQPYFLGASPSSVDATGYGFIANIIWAPIDSPLAERARSIPALRAYAERMKARYFS